MWLVGGLHLRFPALTHVNASPVRPCMLLVDEQGGSGNTPSQSRSGGAVARSTCKEVQKALPKEYAAETQQLVAISLEGSAR